MNCFYSYFILQYEVIWVRFGNYDFNHNPFNDNGVKFLTEMEKNLLILRRLKLKKINLSELNNFDESKLT